MNRTQRGLAVVLGLCTGVTAYADDPALSGHAVRGAALYASRCGACHSVDEDRIGPHHRGIVGRKAGGIGGYEYSEALAKAQFVWNRELLMKWLTDPERLVPGQKMGYRLDRAQDRADIVAYLGTLKD
jgi:cytochrome c